MAMLVYRKVTYIFQTYLPEVYSNSSPLKNDGWKTILSLLGFGNFSGANC